MMLKIAAHRLAKKNHLNQALKMYISVLKLAFLTWESMETCSYLEPGVTTILVTSPVASRLTGGVWPFNTSDHSSFCATPLPSMSFCKIHCPLLPTLIITLTFHCISTGFWYVYIVNAVFFIKVLSFYCLSLFFFNSWSNWFRCVSIM